MMAPIRTIFAFALLAFGIVDAKDKVAFSQYDNEDCDGHPQDGFTNLRLRNGQSDCKDVTARGIKFHKSLRNRWNGWIDDASHGTSKCWANLYEDHGCEGESVSVSLPQQFQQCIPLEELQYSVKFFCREGGWDAVQKEIHLPITSYSIAPDGKAHPSVYTTAINVTVTDYHTKALPTKKPAFHLDPRGEPIHKPIVKPRADYNIRNVWMKHPWTSSDICYHCYTDHEASWDDWRCESSVAGTNRVSCEDKPAPSPETSTHVVTHTTDASIYFTSIDQINEPPMAMMERSEHLPIVMKSPWTEGLVCGQAKWKHMGDDDEKIRIKDDDCDKAAVNIAIDYPHYVVSSATTETRWIYHPSTLPKPTATDDGAVVTYTTVVLTTYLAEITSTVNAHHGKHRAH